jgi:septal ring factor EnvC (AmiA/AmiB activator)
MRFKIGTAGAMEEFIKGLNVLKIKAFGDGKLLIVYEGDQASITPGEIKEVQVDNPKLLEEVENLKAELNADKVRAFNFQKLNGEHLEEIKSLKAQLDACQKECKSLKTKNEKLRKALEAIE